MSLPFPVKKPLLKASEFFSGELRADLYWTLPAKNYVYFVSEREMYEESLKGDIEELKRRIFEVEGVNQIKLILIVNLHTKIL